MKHSCPDSRTLELYLNGTLPDTELHSVREHLASCELCSEAVEGLSRIPDFSIVNELRKDVYERFGKENSTSRIITLFTPLRAAASLIIITGIAAAIYLIMLDESETKLVGDQFEVKTEKSLESVPPPPVTPKEDKPEEQLNVTEKIPTKEPAPKAEERQEILKLGEDWEFSQGTVTGEKTNEVVEEESVTDEIGPPEISGKPAAPSIDQTVTMDKDFERNDDIPMSESAKREETKSVSRAKKKANVNSGSAEQSAPAAVQQVSGNTAGSTAEFSSVYNNQVIISDTVSYLDSLRKYASSPQNCEAGIALAEYFLRNQQTEKAKVILLETDQKENPCRVKARALLDQIK